MEEGIFEEKENRILQNLIRLKNMKVSEIMTPRTVVSIANENMSWNEFLKNKEYLKFSRIPVFSQKEENICGYVFRQTIFDKMADNNDGLQLKDIKREILVIPDTMSVFNVWELFSEKKELIALIVDEYGTMDGIVTMEDIVETLVGIEIVDEKDTITDMQQYARERWELKQKKYHTEN
jgi:CBS domain containing-hemolysin-like protein